MTTMALPGKVALNDSLAKWYGRSAALFLTDSILHNGDALLGSSTRRRWEIDRGRDSERRMLAARRAFEQQNGNVVALRL